MYNQDELKKGKAFSSIYQQKIVVKKHSFNFYRYKRVGGPISKVYQSKLQARVWFISWTNEQRDGSWNYFLLELNFPEIQIINSLACCFPLIIN